MADFCSVKSVLFCQERSWKDEPAIFCERKFDANACLARSSSSFCHWFGARDLQTMLPMTKPPECRVAAAGVDKRHFAEY